MLPDILFNRIKEVSDRLNIPQDDLIRREKS